MWGGRGRQLAMEQPDDDDTASWESFHRNDLIDLKSIFRVIESNFIVRLDGAIERKLTDCQVGVID